MPRMHSIGWVGCLAISLSGCVTSHVMLGKAHPPIPPSQVKIYFGWPKTPFERIAILDTSSRASLAITAQGKMDKVIERLKDEAAKLGANGVVLEGVGDRPAGEIGTGIGQSTFSGNGALGLGIGFSGAIYQKVGHGIAIYVEPGGAKGAG